MSVNDSYQHSDSAGGDVDMLHSPQPHLSPHPPNNGAVPGDSGQHPPMIPPFAHIPPFTQPHNEQQVHHDVPPVPPHILQQPPPQLPAFLPPPPVVDIKSLPPPPVVDAAKLDTAQQHNLYVEKLDYELQHNIYQFIHTFAALSYPIQVHSLQQSPPYINDQHIAAALNTVSVAQQMTLLKHVPTQRQKSVIKSMTAEQRTALYQYIASATGKAETTSTASADVKPQPTQQQHKVTEELPDSKYTTEYSDNPAEFTYVPPHLRSVDLTLPNHIVATIESILYGYGNIYTQVNAYAIHLLAQHLQHWLHTLCNKHLSQHHRYRQVLFALYPIQCMQYYKFKAIRKQYVESELNNEEFDAEATIDKLTSGNLGDDDVAGAASGSPQPTTNGPSAVQHNNDTVDTTAEHGTNEARRKNKRAEPADMTMLRRSARIAQILVAPRYTEIETSESEIEDSDESEDDEPSSKQPRARRADKAVYQPFEAIESYNIEQYNIQCNAKSRLRFLNDVASQLTDAEYAKFCAARQTSFTNSRYDKQLFAQWIGATFKLPSPLLNILNYLVIDRIGMIAQVCRQCRLSGEHSKTPLSWQCNEVQHAIDVLESNTYTSVSKLETLSTPLVSIKTVKQQIHSVALPPRNHPKLHTAIEVTDDTNNADASPTTLLSPSPSPVPSSDKPAYQYNATTDITRLDDTLAAALLNKPQPLDKLYERPAPAPHTAQQPTESLKPPAADPALATITHSVPDTPALVSPPIPPLESALSPPSNALTGSNAHCNEYNLAHPSITGHTDDADMSISLQQYDLSRPQHNDQPKSSNKRTAAALDSDDSNYHSNTSHTSTPAQPRRSSNIGKGNKQKFPESIHKMMHDFAVALQWKFKLKSPIVKQFEAVSGLKPQQLRSWIQNNKPAELKRTFAADAQNASNRNTHTAHQQQHDMDQYNTDSD